MELISLLLSFSLVHYLFLFCSESKHDAMVSNSMPYYKHCGPLG